MDSFSFFVLLSFLHKRVRNMLDPAAGSPTATLLRLLLPPMKEHRLNSTPAFTHARIGIRLLSR